MSTKSMTYPRSEPVDDVLGSAGDQAGQADEPLPLGRFGKIIDDQAEGGRVEDEEMTVIQGCFI